MIRLVGSFRLTVLSRSSSTVAKSTQSGHNAALHRSADQRDVTQMDILEERIKNREEVREIKIQGQTQKWAYRSEMVKKLDLDMDHRRIWIAFSLIIFLGFGSFVYVKSNVVLGRREEMEQREKMRKELNLHGADRKKISVVDN
ncbi:hypothetical protein PRIPAC_80046 [Pristionchus pacificus]|uniref:Uncharacterized protein n=1 Tax=Pristionchus pacificus TaxID=54126 RepID=A0A2A6C449_PRIPA|nr:hypothetical protein PRIPAC_80046 [Pristionchus pacificus]|eukprot:PDM72823.1 hypothetical protein PRIPAC_39257 [Pristionchus pacificus]